MGVLAEPTIYYATFDAPPRLASRLLDRMKRLPDTLSESEIGLRIRVAPLPKDLSGPIRAALRAESVQEAASDVLDALIDNMGLGRPGYPGVLIGLESNHSLVQRCLQSNPGALWGATLGRLAVVYGCYHEAVFCHETLHLLGATDCYDTDEPTRDRRPTCGVSSCIMQYDSVAGYAVGKRLLCDQNLKRISEQCARHAGAQEEP